MKSVAAKRRLAQEWAGVRRYHDWIKASTLGGVDFVSSRFLDFCHSLVLVHAYSVLQAALRQYKQEQAFVAKGGELAVLMRASRTVLAWQDYRTVNTGRAKRNAVAHKGQFLPSGPNAGTMVSAPDNDRLELTKSAQAIELRSLPRCSATWAVERY